MNSSRSSGPLRSSLNDRPKRDAPESASSGVTVTISWHSLAAQDVLTHLGSTERGLGVEEAKKRLEADGPNTLPAEKSRPVWLLFLSQFQSPLIYLLIAAAGVVFALGETTDAYIIIAILVFNAVVGAIQEGRAQDTLRALKRFVETRATVLRGGETFVIPDREVVRGDVILLEAGEKIPADARIINSKNLKIDEATLTGESGPVGKTAESEREGIPLSERRSMVFMGTHVVAGSARAVAVSTGTKTEVGAIARRVRDIDTEIPLRVEIRALANGIIRVVALGGVALFTIGILGGHTVREMVATVVSLSVSVIPEGLPIVITLVLATGVWQMSKRNALVKRLQAVEALGQANVIAVDKTGTITRNELVIRTAIVGGERYEIEGDGYTPVGRATQGGKPIDLAKHPVLAELIETATRSAAGRLSYDEAEKRWRIAGDPTEASMIVLGEKLGFRKNDLERAAPLLEETPFDHALKYHATVHQVGPEPYLTVTGAPEAVISLCTLSYENGTARPLSEKARSEIHDGLLSLSQKGLRVLAVAVRRGASGASPAAIGGLTFLGYLGMEDTLRPEVAGALKAARDAEIRVVMITGDHVETARAIAREAGIYREGDGVLTGVEIDAMFDAELAKALELAVVFARVTQEHKLRIIKADKI
ncbi:MAG: HAD-IC family P-type ATPase, partial [Patescibacteria group bacterium]